MVKDLPSKSLIGRGKYQDGLYLLEPTHNEGISMKVGILVEASLWHFRLGHTSDAKLITIGMCTDNKNENKVPCDSCIRAKQTPL